MINITTRLKGLILLCALYLLAAVPCLGLTVNEENEVSREFLSYVFNNYEVVTDPEIAGYIQELGDRILSKYPPQPFKYSFYVIKNETYNAFAGPGAQIFIHTGLFDALKSEDALAGIVGHEISHSACRHISENIDRSEKIGLGTLAGVAAGIFMSIYGDPAAGTALTVGSIAGGQTAALAYSREDELQADQVGLYYLLQAGYDPGGLIDALNIIRSKQWYGQEQIPAYLNTHPALEDRISYIHNWIDTHPGAIKPHRPEEDFEFRMIHTKIKAMYGKPEEAQVYFKALLEKDPGNLFGLYGLGMVYDRLGKMDQAVDYLKRALEKRALHVGILKTLGKSYFKAGMYSNAKGAFESALSLVPRDFESNLYLARIMAESGQYDTAVSLLMPFSMEERGKAAAFYYLGDIYARKGMMMESYFNLGLYFQMRRDMHSALNQYERALKQEGSPELKEKIQSRIDEIKHTKKDEPKAQKSEPSFRAVMP